MKKLFGEEFGLRGGCGCGGSAAGDADDAENGEGRDRGAGNEDAVGVGGKVGWSELDAIVEQPKKVVGHNAFEDFAVGVAESNPKAIELGTRQEGFAFGFEVSVEFTHEVERADAVEWNLFVGAVGRKEIERVDLTETGRVEVSLQGLAVHERDHDLLVGRGWGTELQVSRFWRELQCCRWLSRFL